jgi:serine/threonine-protein kinase
MMSAEKTAGRPTLAGMKFLVEGILGTDDGGKVMRISDQGELGKLYALKIVDRKEPQDDAKLARCRAAAEASLKLGHPAILKYHDYRDRKSWFRVVRGELLMEYVAGKNLNELAKSLKVNQWVLVFKHIAGAVAHMHRRGVFHGDITPGRVMLASSGAVKVFGYGQSLLKEKGHRTTNKQFAAPEQIRQNTIDEKTEIYGVGSLMYYLITTKTPNLLRARGGEDDSAVKLPRPSDVNKRVPAALDDVILACIQRHPERRPEGMFDVLKGLEDLARALHLEDGMLKGAAVPKQEEEPSPNL